MDMSRSRSSGKSLYRGEKLADFIAPPWKSAGVVEDDGGGVRQGRRRSSAVATASRWRFPSLSALPLDRSRG